MPTLREVEVLIKNASVLFDHPDPLYYGDSPDAGTALAQVTKKMAHKEVFQWFKAELEQLLNVPLDLAAEEQKQEGAGTLSADQAILNNVHS